MNVIALQGWGRYDRRSDRRLSRMLATLVGWVALSSPTIAEELTQSQQVGPVKVTTTLSPSEPTIGDEIELELHIESEANVELLLPEFGEALERYTIVDFVPRQHIEADGTVVMSQKYTLQPAASGEQSIPPILVEFIDSRPGSQPAPDDFDAYEILTDRIDFTVKSVLPTDAAAELMPPLGELELKSSGQSTRMWMAAVVVVAIIAAVAASLLAARWRHRVRRRSAYEIARSRLDRLLLDRHSEKPRLSIEQFFVEISAVIRQYLEHRFEVRAPELTTDEFLQLAAAESELSREHQSLLGEFLQQADIVKFAGVQASEREVKRSSDLALQFLEDTRENAPEIEDDAQPDDGVSGPPANPDREAARV